MKDKKLRLQGHDLAIIVNALSIYASETMEALEQKGVKADLGDRIATGLGKDAARAAQISDAIENAAYVDIEGIESFDELGL